MHVTETEPLSKGCLVNLHSVSIQRTESISRNIGKLNKAKNQVHYVFAWINLKFRVRVWQSIRIPNSIRNQKTKKIKKILNLWKFSFQFL